MAIVGGTSDPARNDKPREDMDSVIIENEVVSPEYRAALYRLQAAIESAGRRDNGSKFDDTGTGTQQPSIQPPG